MTKKTLSPALRVLKNSTALTLSTLAERFVIFLLPWYVARVQGKEIWGDYSTALAFVTIAATIAPWGLVGLLPRKIARNQEEAGRLFVNSAFIGAVGTLLTTAVVFIVVGWLEYPPHVEQLIKTGLLIVLLPRTEVVLFETAIKGLEKMEWIVAVRLPLTIARVIATIFLLSKGYDIGILFKLLSIYYLFNLLFYLLIFLRLVPKFSFKPNKQLIKLLFIQSLPFFMIISISEMIRQLDRVFISKYWDTTSVGIYATGIMFIQLLYMIAPAIMSALTPGLSRAYINAPIRFSDLISWMFKILTVGMFPVALLTISLAGWIIPLIFGTQYGESVTVMRLAALGIVPSYLARLLYRAIVASNNERFVVWVTIVSNVVSLALNMVLIPRYGIIGASIASVSVILLNVVQNFWFATKTVQFDYRGALFYPAGCIALSSLVYLGFIQWHYELAFMAAMVVFTVTIFATKTISRKDLAYLSLTRGE